MIEHSRDPDFTDENPHIGARKWTNDKCFQVADQSTGSAEVEAAFDQLRFRVDSLSPAELERARDSALGGMIPNDQFGQQAAEDLFHAVERKLNS